MHICFHRSRQFFLSFFGHELIASMYAGQSFDILNNLIEDHRAGRPWANLEHYFTLSKLFYSRFLVVCIAIQLTMVAALKYRVFLSIKRIGSLPRRHIPSIWQCFE